MKKLRQTRLLLGLARQRGQAMVEFAIIALLLILLIAGGVELGIAAVNSNRTSEGAKAAANQWMQHLGSGAVYQELGSSGVYGFELTSGRGLGNHYNLNAFARPSCNTDDSYNDGLPADGQVYLYNPLPIDITECTGKDALETARSRVSVLLSGHRESTKLDNPGDPRLHNGLPAIHQSMYSQYEKVCVNASLNSYLDCSDYNQANPDHRILLKLPGVLSDKTSQNIGPLYQDAMSRLAKIVNDTVNNRFILDEADPDNNIRLYPTFHISCAPAAQGNFGSGSTYAMEENCDSSDTAPLADNPPAGICWFDDGGTARPLACNVQVETRYRYTFQTFLSLTLAEDNEPEMTPVQSGAAGFFDYQSDAPGTLGNGLQQGNAPKPYRDFLGCYHTSALGAASPGQYLTSYNIISCN